MRRHKSAPIPRSFLSASILSCVLLAGGAAYAGPATYFSKSQVQAGKKAYAQNCAACHGSSLQGGAGPALEGSKFESSLKFGNMSSKQLYEFIAQHMPKNDPGSLSESHYLQIFSYILSQNGFPSGQADLTKKDVKKIKLLPLPDQKHASGNQ